MLGCSVQESKLVFTRRNSRGGWHRKPHAGHFTVARVSMISPQHPSRVTILPFIIFQGTGLSNSYFESSFLLFSLMSSCLDTCAGLTRGVQALLLHVCHCWRYVASVQPLRQGCGDAFPDSPLPCLHWVLPESLCALHFITCSLSFYCLFMLIFLPESDTGFITHLCESLAWRSDIVKRKDLEGKTWEILSLFWFCDKVCKWLGQSQAPSGKRGG